MWPKNEALNPTLLAGDVLHESLSAVDEVEIEQANRAMSVLFDIFCTHGLACA